MLCHFDVWSSPLLRLDIADQLPKYGLNLGAGASTLTSPLNKGYVTFRHMHSHITWAMHWPMSLLLLRSFLLWLATFQRDEMQLRHPTISRETPSGSRHRSFASRIKRWRRWSYTSYQLHLFSVCDMYCGMLTTPAEIDSVPLDQDYHPQLLFQAKEAKQQRRSSEYLLIQMI